LENQGRHVIHFSFSINPNNSDFLLRPEIAPAIFSRILNALTLDRLEIKHLPIYFTDEKIDVSTNQYLPKLDLTDFERTISNTFIDIGKSTIVSLPNPEKPRIFTLHAGKNAEFVAINPHRTDINMIENANLMNLQTPKPKNPEDKKENADEKDKYLILLIQIALLLVITEAVFYRLKLTE